ncbi:Bifunctional protein RIB2 [Zancudomyces culisetae]|uniref:Bifunctional protein RIB2 n=1 Tax=Zancudomyces culisetae TaxID=1213189 RepID=A0A1R1PVH6_ZANCU|nr:Bifunctional protein RIB2 [Zancudomyces culisetae]|eukprot:OMH84976.1 Bifunctional protein RIB2 [Zancudomyces culisetae]
MSDAKLEITDEDIRFFEVALQEAKKCENVETAFNVGCVIVDALTNKVLTTGYSREIEGNTHAEENALNKLHGSRPRIKLYTTMIPCTKRLSGNKTCAERIVEYGNVETVYFGTPEPENFVVNDTCVGFLEKHEIRVVQIVGFQNDSLEANRHLLKKG